MHQYPDILPIIIHFPADDPVLEGLLNSPVTKDWTFKDEEDDGQGQLSLKGYAKLLCDIANEQWDGIDYEGRVCLPRRSALATDHSDGKATSLLQYSQRLLSAMGASCFSERNKGKRYVIGFNLLGFDVQDKHIDQISLAVIDYLKASPSLNQHGNTLIFMLRSLKEITPEDTDDVPLNFRKLIEQADRRIGIRVFGYEERKRYLVDRITSPGYLERKRVEPGILFEALNATSKTVEEELIFRTNMQIGHFVLASSHIRTHYSIGEFIQRDFVKEYFFHELFSVFRDYQKKKNCIIVAGIEETSLYRVASDFARMSEKTIDIISNSSLDSESNRLSNCDTILILSDIVNTGNTIGECVDKVYELLGKEGKTIKLYAIARMTNTPEKIRNQRLKCLVDIKRPFYESASKCPLCKVDQPYPNNGSPITSLDGFKHTAEQLTPFDFWEIVDERSALFFVDIDEKNELRVSTTQSKKKKHGIANRYQKWFQTLVSRELSLSGWVNGSIDLIVTIDAPSGEQFSAIVARALHLNETNILRIARGDDRPFPLLPKGKGKYQVLLVDDGINSGDTIKFLAKFCGDVCRIIGGIVFDSRLSQSELKDITHECNIVGSLRALYYWKQSGRSPEEQLEKMIELWDGDEIKFEPIGAMIDYLWRSGKPVDELFDSNPALYFDAFLNEDILSIDDRERFIQLVATSEKALKRLGRNDIRDRYPALSEVACAIETSRKHSINSSLSNKHLDAEAIEGSVSEDVRHIDANHDINGISGYIEDLLQKCTVPIVGNKSDDAYKTPIGTGFLLKVSNTSVAYSPSHSEVLIITCGHVIKADNRESLSVLLNGTYYGAKVEYINDGEDKKTSKDIAILQFNESLDDVQAFHIADLPLHDKNAAFFSYGYQTNNALAPDYYYPLSRLRMGGQAGTVILINEGTTRMDGGSSGSPIVSKDGLLVGLATNIVPGPSQQEQQIVMAPISDIKEVISAYHRSKST